MDTNISLNVMKALQGTNQQQQQQNGAGGSGMPQLPAGMPGAQIFNMAMQALQGLLAQSKSGDKSEEMPSGEKGSIKNAVGGVSNGRLGAQRDQLGN